MNTKYSVVKKKWNLDLMHIDLSSAFQNFETALDDKRFRNAL